MEELIDNPKGYWTQVDLERDSFIGWGSHMNEQFMGKLVQDLVREPSGSDIYLCLLISFLCVELNLGSGNKDVYIENEIIPHVLDFIWTKKDRCKEIQHPRQRGDEEEPRELNLASQVV